MEAVTLEQEIEKRIREILDKELVLSRDNKSDFGLCITYGETVAALASFIRSRDRDIAEKAWAAGYNRAKAEELNDPVMLKQEQLRWQYLSQFSSPINSKTDE